MSHKEKSITKNSIYYMGYQVANMLFPFLTSMYVARILLPEAVGKVASAENIAAYFVIFAYLGIPTYGLREIAKVRHDKTALSKVYSELLIINFCSTAIFFAIYLGVVFSVDKFRENLPLYLITGGSIAINVLNNSWLYEGLEEFGFISARNVAFKILSFVILVLTVKSPDDYLMYAAITVIGTAGNYIINVFYSKKFVDFTTKNLEFKRHLKPIFTLVVVNLAIQLYSLVDVTMLGAFSENNHVAYYAYATRINNILKQVVNAFTVVVVPRMAFYYKENKITEFGDLISQTANIIVIISVFFIGTLQLMASPLIVLLYGKTFLASAVVIKILSVLLLISPIGYLMGSRTLLVTGHETEMAFCVAIGALVNVIGNYILIPRYSECGAAVASVISELIVMIVYLILASKYYRSHGIILELLKCGIAGLFMGVSIYLVRICVSNDLIYIILGGVMAVLSYFGALIALKDRMVRKYLVRIVERLGY
jgi:O-antigen/teichoic acid export membrane protein